MHNEQVVFFYYTLNQQMSLIYNNNIKAIICHIFRALLTTIREYKNCTK